MACRSGCGACCIAISISSPIPGMSGGKPAGVRCIHLAADQRCELFNDPSRPKVCHDFQATLDFCGHNREEALTLIGRWEQLTTS
jgi:Fe-S-cluster containining protein